MGIYCCYHVPNIVALSGTLPELPVALPPPSLVSRLSPKFRQRGKNSNNRASNLIARCGCGRRESGKKGIPILTYRSAGRKWLNNSWTFYVQIYYTYLHIRYTYRLYSHPLVTR
jgi:hypothetical protein